MKYKFLSGVAAVLMTVGLAGCEQEDPEDIVEKYLTALQKGDLEKAENYIKDDEDVISDGEEEEMTEEWVKAISQNGYEFKKPSKISESGNKAKVEVEITSVDFGAVIEETITKVMPTDFSAATDEEAEKLVSDEILKNIKDKNAQKDTRVVTLNLKKNKNNEYQIMPDEEAKEAILANIGEYNDLLGIDSEDELEETNFKVVDMIDGIDDVQAKPMVLDIEEISIRKAINLSPEELEWICDSTQKEVANGFEFLYIKYATENTSDKDVDFNGIQEITLSSGGKQETVNVLNENFIDSDDFEKKPYNGKVKRNGEIGVIFNHDLEKADTIRFAISPAFDPETFESYTEKQVIEWKHQN